MPAFKPAYLIHGEDHGRIAERRARLRRLAEEASGAQGIEVFEGERTTPEAVAAALSAMTLAVGRRFIIVDGVERWKERELEPLEEAMKALPPDTTVAFFGREDGRIRVSKRLHDAVRGAGGDVSAEESVKPWELSRWVRARASELGLELGVDAARTLIEHVGERPQRLLRELEKLALWAGADERIGAEEIEELTAPSAERKVWALADALVGSDGQAATQLFLTLRAQGERVPGLMYWMAGRVRSAIEVAQALEAGVPAAQIKRGLRMPAPAADRLIADASRSGVAKLRGALERLADVELATRGGGPSAASADTEMVRAIEQTAG